MMCERVPRRNHSYTGCMMIYEKGGFQKELRMEKGESGNTYGWDGGEQAG